MQVSPLLNNLLQPFTFERMCVRLTCLCVLIAVACVHALKGVGHPNTRMPLSCYATALEEMGKLDPRVAGGEGGRAGGAKRKRATGQAILQDFLLKEILQKKLVCII